MNHGGDALVVYWQSTLPFENGALAPFAAYPYTYGAHAAAAVDIDCDFTLRKLDTRVTSVTADRKIITHTSSHTVRRNIFPAQRCFV